MPTIRRHPYIAAILLLLAVACADEPLPTGPDGPLECATPGGRTYSGTIDGSHTWTRADAPHRLMNTVTVGGTLTIEAGALVCGEPESVITARTLRIDGTQTAPVVLTATDSLAGWGGIRASDSDQPGDSTVIRFASIRHAAVHAHSFGHVVLLENSTVFGARGPALSGGSFMARDVVIDSACAGAQSAGACWAVAGTPYHGIDLVDPVISSSRGGGIYVPYRSHLNLTGGSIIDSRGIGVYLRYDIAGSGTMTLHSPVRITGGDTIPIVVAGALPAGLASRAAQLELLGNAIDQMHIEGPYGGPERTVYPELPWTLRPEPFCQVLWHIGTLRIEAGASVYLDSACEAVGQIVGEGTATDPVTIASDSGRVRSWTPFEDLEIPAVIQLTHARIIGTELSFEESPALLSDVEFERSSIALAAPGSRLVRVHVHNVGGNDDGITISADDVTISDCTIEDNAGDGVRVNAGGPRIERCNIRNNQGVGVRNVGVGTVDAADNWWGDAAGPAGPGGDGVAGTVLYSPWRMEPVIW